MTVQFTNAELRTARIVASSLERTYGIPADDIIQECAAWMTRRFDKVLEYRAGKPGLFTTLSRLGVKYCRRELGATTIGAAEDHYTYSRKELKRLLPLVLEADAGQLSSMDFEDLPGSGGDPALGGDEMAKVADVKSALLEIPEAHAAVLLRAAELDFEYAELGAEIHGEDGEPIGRKAATQRVNYYLDSLRKALDGDVRATVREVRSTDDAQRFYRRQLRGMEEYTGRRWVSTEDDSEAITENHYRQHGAAWDSY